MKAIRDPGDLRCCMNQSVTKGDLVAKSISSARVAGGSAGAVTVESVADILERELDTVIQEWLIRVEKEPELTAIPLNFEDRTGHLPQLLRDVIVRLRLDDGTKAPISQAAAHHGDLRAQKGYTVAMAVEESRLLQVSIFTTLQRSERNLEFEMVLPAVAMIADEVDAQLKQQMLRFMASNAAKAAKVAKAAKMG
jgi:RsbT co-antagonist protein rsbRD N-terminal domain